MKDGIFRQNDFKCWKFFTFLAWNWLPSPYSFFLRNKIRFSMHIFGKLLWKQKRLALSFINLKFIHSGIVIISSRRIFRGFIQTRDAIYSLTLELNLSFVVLHVFSHKISFCYTILDYFGVKSQRSTQSWISLSNNYWKNVEKYCLNLFMMLIDCTDWSYSKMMFFWETFMNCKQDPT